MRSELLGRIYQQHSARTDKGELLPQWLAVVKDALILLLMVVALLTIFANYKWIEDYRARLMNGVEHILNADNTTFKEKEALGRMQWANAKLLALVALMLGILSQTKELGLVGREHLVPILATLLLIFVALFDASLDLEAESTIQGFGIIRAVQRAASATGTAGHPLSIASALWKCNQTDPAHEQLYEEVRNGQKPKYIPFTAFTTLAKNVISFAILVIFLLAGAELVFLAEKLVWPF